MKYDDATWHSGGNFPSESPDEYGGTHIALFLKWCLTKGWAGELLLEEPEAVRQVIDGSLSATDFLFNYCDGQLTDDCLNEEGNAFAEEYYGEGGFYLLDYTEHFGDLLYVAPESAHDFGQFSKILDARLQSGVLNQN
jgi:hypothetical protein